jgi:hypothetical protein
MKPFDLKQALEGKRVQTRDGRSVKQIAHFLEAAPAYRVMTLVEGDNVPMGKNEDGTTFCSGIRSGSDLFMVSEEKRGWIILTKENGRFDCQDVVAGIFPSKEEVLKRFKIGSDRIVVEITWEE